METKYLLKMDNIAKEYFGNKVLKGVQLHVAPGEIHALMGENGAGKSTLMNILFGMPVMYPMAVCMALELATYAAVAGMLYRVFPQKRRFLYVSLIISMILGSLVWGLARFLCAGLDISTFGLSAFWTGAVAMSVPGILLQLLIVPALVIVSEKYISGKQ